MKQSLFLPSELDFRVLKFHNSTTNIDFEVCSCQISSCCPLCQTISFKIHITYARTIGDLPVSGKLAKLKLQVRKFFCENSDCTRKIFTERFRAAITIWAKSIYYWTYRSLPSSTFLKISFRNSINRLIDQAFALIIESPLLKYEIANREGLSL